VDRGQPELSGRRCAVLGAPIAHSLSPALHRAAYAHLGLDWRYDAVEVTEPELSAFVAGLDATWRGLSLTMPLKGQAVAVADRADPLVQVVGAANTLVRTDDGAWVASNTDVPGIAAALAEVGVAQVGSATVLGGGSTAASALAALAGISRDVVVCVRSPARAGGLHRVASAVGIGLQVVAWDDAAAHLPAPLVVATTPTGAADALAAFVPDAPGALLDVVYDPWPTPLAQAWAAAGGTVRSGLDLLAHQAVLQVRLMTGQDVPVEVLRTAGEQALAQTAQGSGSGTGSAG
jgi:shikimate dehydrogenase